MGIGRVLLVFQVTEGERDDFSRREFRVMKGIKDIYDLMTKNKVQKIEGKVGDGIERDIKFLPYCFRQKRTDTIIREQTVPDPDKNSFFLLHDMILFLQHL